MIHFCAIDPLMAEAWEQAKIAGEDVNVFRGSIFDVPTRGTVALVSPANSFGFMDGGIDLELAAIFPGIEARVTNAIEQRRREMLVGESAVFRVKHPQYRALIVAPTMRFPQDISGTINTYLATMAAFRSVDHYDNILFPAMGAGIGKMPPALCAHQMFRAYRDTVNPPEFNSCADVAQHHWDLMHP